MAYLFLVDYSCVWRNVYGSCWKKESDFRGMIKNQDFYRRYRIVNFCGSCVKFKCTQCGSEDIFVFSKFILVLEFWFFPLQQTWKYMQILLFTTSMISPSSAGALNLSTYSTIKSHPATTSNNILTFDLYYQVPSLSSNQLLASELGVPL